MTSCDVHFIVILKPPIALRVFTSVVVSSLLPQVIPIVLLEMAMQYVNYVKNRVHPKKSEIPVLSEEDEHFFNRITSHDGQAPPLPAEPRAQDLATASETRGNDAQVALLDGAQNIALPETPNEITSEPEAMHDPLTGSQKSSEHKPARNTWSWLRRDSRDLKRKV